MGPSPTGRAAFLIMLSRLAYGLGYKYILFGAKIKIGVSGPLHDIRSDRYQTPASSPTDLFNLLSQYDTR